MNTSLEQYSPSGRFGVSTIAYALVGAVGLALVAWVYTLLLTWIPFIYVEFIIVFGFGFVAAMAGTLIVDYGHCRNKLLAVGLGLMLGGAAWLASFGWGYFAVLGELRESYPELSRGEIAQGFSFMQWIDARVEHGWTIKSSSISGILVWILWAIEGAILVGFPVLLMWGRAKEVYCETCKTWNDKQTAGLMGLTKEDVQPLLELGDLTGLFQLQPNTEKSDSKIAFERSFCQTCFDKSYVTVTELIFTPNGKGGVDEKKTELVEHALLTPPMADVFTARLLAPERGPAIAPA